MSSDYTNSKQATGVAYPENKIDSDFSRLEPLLTPEQLISRYLFGIPLVSFLVNPITGKHDVMTKDMLQDYIIRAVSKAEVLTGIDIFPVKYSEKVAFDRNLYLSFGYIQSTHKPIQSVDKLSVLPSNGVDVYIIAPEWIEPARFHRGQINIIPIQVGFQGGSYIPVDSNGMGGAYFLSILSGFNFIPSFWGLDYTTGFQDGAIPKFVNELIGCIAAMDILGMLMTTYRTSGHSLNLDGGGQSVSYNVLPVFQARIELLTQQRNEYIGKMKSLFTGKFVVGNV